MPGITGFLTVQFALWQLFVNTFHYYIKDS